MSLSLVCSPAGPCEEGQTLINPVRPWLKLLSLTLATLRSFLVFPINLECRNNGTIEKNERKSRALEMVACQFPGALESCRTPFFFSLNFFGLFAAKNARCLRHVIKNCKTCLSVTVYSTTKFSRSVARTILHI